jgi:hypothetical protein
MCFYEAPATCATIPTLPRGALKSVLRKKYKTVPNILGAVSRRPWQRADLAAQPTGTSVLPARRSRDPATCAASGASWKSVLRGKYKTVPNILGAVSAVCGRVRTLPRSRRRCRRSQRGGVATLPHARQVARLEKVFCGKNIRLSPIFGARFTAVCGSVRTLPRCRRGCRRSQRGGVATLPHARQVARLEKVFCGKNYKSVHYVC